MTRGRRVKKEAVTEEPEESFDSQYSVARRTANMDLGGDSDMVDPSDASSSFVSVNHGLPGMMTPVSFSGPSGPIGGLNTNDDQQRRSMAPSTEESGVHLVGKEAQVLVDAINDFRKFGVDHVVQLPELVLVGDQSAGKSSLMGALTEIHLPRASGICTRCPALIKTSEAPTWTCTVSLHREYRYNPQSGRQPQPTKDRPFPPWDRQHLVTSPFKTIHNKKDLEEVLKWAQIAILNDSKDYHRYIPGYTTFANDTTTEAKFSPNVVSVEISGPSLPSLSFYDLPGIFQNTPEKEDEYLIKVIENLAKTYIKRKRATIICAIPMSMDPANSRTRKIVSDLHAEMRCIGVLTMADRLQEGQTHSDYEKILRGMEHRLQYGYFITKLPGGSSETYDPNYHAKARREEEEFFKTRKPWSTEWKEFSGRCGTMPLQHALSQVFASQIKASLPDMQLKIRQRQREIDQELDNLPELPFDNIFLIVIQHLGAFSLDIKNILNGGSTHNAFHSSFSKLCEQFLGAVLAMKPVVRVSHASDKPVAEVIDLIDSDGEGADNNTISPHKPPYQGSSSINNIGKRLQSDQGPSTPTKRPRSHASDLGSGQYDGSLDSTTVRPKAEDRGPIPFRQPTPVRRMPVPNQSEGLDANPFVDIMAQHKVHPAFAMSLGSIHSKIQEHQKAGLPGVVNPMVYTELCLKSVQQWKIPCQRLLECTLRMLRSAANDILTNTFQKWRQTQLYQQSQDHLTEFFDQLELSQQETLEHLCLLEANNDFTVNKAALELYIKEESAGICEVRKKTRAKSLAEGKMNKEGKRFKDEESRKHAVATTTKAIEENLPADPFQPELNVAGYVRGYYKTAALRFVDSVCLSIHGKLFHDVRQRIDFFLESELGVYEGGEERCRELLEEDASIAVKRHELKREKESLAKFTERLLQLANETAALEAGDYQSMVEDCEDEDATA